ncbi:glycosyltransferase family 9 protein [Fontivita pretiosa]|uniref:glycosyltransferase family 9 protein n=1 Tax=Fontivita pretiosa TaxID=2989684 RepID=UPI003D16A54B
MHSREPDNLSIVVPIVAGVGNALMAVPMVRQLKRARPHARVCVLARINAMAEPFRRLPGVDEVFVTGNGLRGQLRAVRWMRQHVPDVLLIPFPSNRWQYNALALASGARRVIAHRYPVGHVRTLAFVVGDRLEAQRGIHDVVQNLRLLQLLDVEPDPTEPPRFALGEHDRNRARQLLGAAGVGDDATFIAIHAGSAKTVLARAKRWPADNYAQLIRMLQQQVCDDIVLLEGPDETGVGDEILNALGSNAQRGDHGVHVMRLSGPLGDAAAVLERARLYVGSDSGLAHLAAAVGTPPVTLFAPADPDRVCPFGYRHLVVQSPRNCGPCFLYPWQATRPVVRCREPYCISAITVSMVMDAVHRALRETAPVAATNKAVHV